MIPDKKSENGETMELTDVTKRGMRDTREIHDLILEIDR